MGRTAKPPANVDAPATSARVFAGMDKILETMLAIVTAPRVGGKALVIFGSKCTRAIVSAAIPLVANPIGLVKCRNDSADVWKCGHHEGQAIYEAQHYWDGHELD